MSGETVDGDEHTGVVRGTSDIVCTECHTTPRLLSLRKNSGTAVGCDCEGPGFSMDSVPYELSIHDLPDEWIVIEGRSARQLSLEVDLCIDGDVYECPRCGDTYGLDERVASCTSCGFIPDRNRWKPQHFATDPDREEDAS